MKVQAQLRRSRSAVKVIGTTVLMLILVLGLLVSQAQQGNPPEIVRIEFPEEILLDDSPGEGKISFKDPDGDIIWAGFEVVEGDFSPFGFNPGVKGQRQGSFKFFISTTIAQWVKLKATLWDEAGNKSEPREFSFLVKPAVPVELPPGVLYQDDFDDPNSGWPVDEWRKYEDGEYSIFIEEENYWGGSVLPGGKFFDTFCASTSTQKVGEPEGAYGILFGYKDNDNTYSFAISTDGWRLVDRLVEGHWIERARWRKSPAVKEGTASNRLKILIDEDHNMKFYINDQLIKTILLEVTYEGGEIGIYAWAFDDGFQAKFDYIKVLEPSQCAR